MSVSYTCPNPACGVTLKTAARVPAGKSVKCPKCGRPFVPEPDEDAAGAGAFKLADDGAKKPAPKPGPAPAAAMPSADDDESEESVKKGYGVIRESEEERREAEKNKPTFKDPKDKFKKSARGPAQALLVMPTNLLVAEGLLTVVAGIVIFVAGMWPLVFNDAPPGEEELEEAIMQMVVGVCCFAWGAMVCFGASQMQELGSYPWAMTGAVMGIVPLLVGIYAIVMLQNPRVKAGFAESEGGPDDDEEDEDEGDEEEDEDDEDEDEDDEDEGDDEDGPVAGAAKRAAARAAKKAGRKLLGGMLGGGEDGEGEDGEEAEEDAKPRKRRKKKSEADEDEE